MRLSKPEIVAFHLPQFHCFEENDKWWGKGFTEWTNTRKATPLFSGHIQPKEPMGKNYYDLLDPDTLVWQMNLAKEYGIDAFCYYHYWFNGKLLLEKPLEIMRNLKERITYFFCWANEPWTRAWEGNTREVLMPQEYGNEKEWEEHFQYLLPFFKDNQYKKIEDKPILVIYRSNNIPRCEDMIDYFNLRCREAGFNGIYVIEEKNNFQTASVCHNADAILEFEPMYTITHGRPLVQRVIDKLHIFIFNKRTGNDMLVFYYDQIWKNILKRKRNDKKKVYLGAFVNWDNTPRKGKKGTVLLGYRPEKFKKYFQKQLNRCNACESEMLFINAWNEWGEGTYLEPDERHGFTNLNCIKTLMPSNKNE